METIVLVLHVMVAVCMVALVLVQQGKGADIGASFGGGSANTMFGSSGPAPFLMKVTAVLGAIFFATSLGMGILASHQQKETNQLIVPTQTLTAPLNVDSEKKKSH